jgi:hypothetical protein
MTGSNKLIKKLFGEDLTSMMCSMLEEFRTLDYDDQQIMKMLKRFNESVRTAMYLLALEKNYDAIAYRINRVNKKLNILRKEDFIEAYENKTVDKYLKTLGKSDKISLLSDLGVDLPLDERMKLPKRKLDYFKIISNSVMLDQESDMRNGLDTFLKYEKEEKEES